MSPNVSVVIPTYNRAEILRRTLTELTRQSVPADQFEVVVADDGSSDHTREVVMSFTDRLAICYHFQEDLGWRANLARHSGASLATGEVLAFLDTGTLPGPEFVAGHYAAHQGVPTGRAVVGYVHGYRPEDPTPGLAEAIEAYPVAGVREHLGHLPSFRDIRHEIFASVDFQLQRRAIPCMLFWSANCSVLAEQYRAVGGFDERYVGWGIEDLDLGFRLQRAGVPFALSRQAWAVEGVHQRDHQANHDSNMRNVVLFMQKYNFSEPLLELTLLAFSQEVFWELEDWYRAALDMTLAYRDVDVSGELARAAAQLAPGTRVAVFGCGGSVPAQLSGATLVDFDKELLARVDAAGGHETYHNIGIRTPLADDSFDMVLMTSRLNGMRERWETEIEQEAKRIGREVRWA